jgi:phosphopantothenoylcysteine decarboxylase / phosphopantothenate---cysteine ligase
VARLLLGVSGGIAAYKALEAVRLAVKRGHVVRVIQTPASERFVGRPSFEALTGAPVLTSEFEADPARGAYPGEPTPERAPISHLALVERAELYLIAPATANTLAKLAHGQADNLLTAAALAAACPIAVAPAMNNRMYLNPATQANLELLGRRGITVIAPGTGELASHGEHGIGRLAEPAELLEAAESLLAPPSYAGARVLVTAGGTREPIDAVRVITNRSSGKQGYAVAERAARRGAAVTLVTTIGRPPPPGTQVVEVQTAAEMQEAVTSRAADQDVIVMAAAVADFRPKEPPNRKLKKHEGLPEIVLEPTHDFLVDLGRSKPAGQILVGFAAETDDLVDNAAEKLRTKRLDLIVGNDISQPDAGFEVDTNRAVILGTDGSVERLPLLAKTALADEILDKVLALIERQKDA